MGLWSIIKGGTPHDAEEAKVLKQLAYLKRLYDAHEDKKHEDAEKLKKEIEDLEETLHKIRIFE